MEKVEKKDQNKNKQEFKSATLTQVVLERPRIEKKFNSNPYQKNSEKKFSIASYSQQLKKINRSEFKQSETRV